MRTGLLWWLHCAMAGGSNYTRLSTKELAQMEAWMKKGNGPSHALTNLKRARALVGEEGPSRSAVYRFYKGDTYQRNQSEKRGRPPQFTDKCLQELNRVRKKLIQDANSEFHVTWHDVCKEGKKALVKKKLLKPRQRMWSADWVARQMRSSLDVRKRPGRARIARTQDDEKKRLEKAEEWGELPKGWWERDIHAYIDNKTFVVPRTTKEKKLMRQARVQYHLRTPEEGASPGFVLPKKNRMEHGLMTIDVTAAVAGDKIIMWHENKKPWSGVAAAAMYAELGKVLRATWGNKRKFRVVEDGDREGFQSWAGRGAKDAERIESWKLPPRSPDLMPLDFCLWDAVEDKTISKSNVVGESLSAYKTRLKRAASRLPKTLVRGCLQSMGKRIQEVIKCKGKHVKMD